ncbi:MAG: hemolysin family protein [Verrucomicrobiales bacterium]
MSLISSTLILASAAGGEIQTHLPFTEGGITGGQFGKELFFLLFFIFLNGFFVAAEFALVKVRESQLDPEIEAGKKNAILVQHILKHLDPYLSACQLGITIASIVLGAVSEPFIAGIFEPLFHKMGLGEDAVRIVSWIIALSAITVLHVVVGEQMPKVFAIRKSLGTSMVCARPLHWFFLIFRGPVWLLNWCATFLLKIIFKLEPIDPHAPGDFSAGELRLLVEETGKAKEVTKREHEILINALELNELSARDIITPRNEVTSLDVSNSFDENLKIALNSKHTRFPLVDGHLDNTKGLVHIKDIIIEMQTETPNLEEVRRDIMIVPELVALDDLLTRFQKSREHMALVVDEYGGSMGLVMLDDVLDQVVGDIQDEFDEDHEVGFERISVDEFVAKGSFPLHELDDVVKELVLASPDVSTVGGYITEVLGHLPTVGEKAKIEGFIATVTDADEKSVKVVRFLRIPKRDDEGEEEGDKPDGDHH